MVFIKPFDFQHFEQLCTIYKQGIQTGIATFQTETPTWSEWDQSHLAFGRLGAFENGLLVGWCSLSPVSKRLVYKGVAEVSVYIQDDYKARGIGKKLLAALIYESESNGIWTLQSGIFIENEASVKLHLHCGFRIAGTREKIGLKNGIWKDNFLLERRSKLVGI